MKRSLFMGAFVGVLVVLGCDSNVEYHNSVQEFGRDEDVEYLLSKTSVNLPDNVSVSDLGMSVDERVQFLVSAKSSMLSRGGMPWSIT